MRSVRPHGCSHAAALERPAPRSGIAVLDRRAGEHRHCDRRNGAYRGAGGLSLLGWRQITVEQSALQGHVLCKLMCKESHMATNLAIDPELLDRAVEVSGVRTKKAVVTMALQEFIARREQRRVVELMGKLEWNDAFDYKAERSRS